jgi:hypothetical protein
MSGLVPGIHVFLLRLERFQDVGGRDEPGQGGCFAEQIGRYSTDSTHS